jgi:4'-phosphopantetheinyl transferase EntD
MPATTQAERKRVAIERLLPPPVVLAQTFQDDPAPELFPEERRHIADAVPSRRREFGTVRGCAREALAGLGVGPVALVPGVQGAPCWPAGVVGSMTHCTGFRAAAVAPAAELAAIGLDAEPNLPLRDREVLEAVTVAQERAWIGVLCAVRPEVCWDRLVFSAKESVYKAWYPLTGRRLDFDEAAITVDAAAGTFTARLLVPGPVLAGEELRRFHGRWLCESGLLVTAATLTHPPSRHA